MRVKAGYRWLLRRATSASEGCSGNGAGWPFERGAPARDGAVGGDDGRLECGAAAGCGAEAAAATFGFGLWRVCATTAPSAAIAKAAAPRAASAPPLTRVIGVVGVHDECQGELLETAHAPLNRATVLSTRLR
jgi:hypothetical protein